MKQKTQYTFCDLEGHENHKLHGLCLSQDCKANGYACGLCINEIHNGHNIVKFPELDLIIKQTLGACEESKNLLSELKENMMSLTKKVKKQFVKFPEELLFQDQLNLEDLNCLSDYLRKDHYFLKRQFRKQVEDCIEHLKKEFEEILKACLDNPNNSQPLATQSSVPNEPPAQIVQKPKPVESKNSDSMVSIDWSFDKKQLRDNIQILNPKQARSSQGGAAYIQPSHSLLGQFTLEIQQLDYTAQFGVIDDMHRPNKYAILQIFPDKLQISSTFENISEHYDFTILKGDQVHISITAEELIFTYKKEQITLKIKQGFKFYVFLNRAEILLK